MINLEWGGVPKNIFVLCAVFPDYDSYEEAEGATTEYSLHIKYPTAEQVASIAMTPIEEEQYNYLKDKGYCYLEGCKITIESREVI